MFEERELSEMARTPERMLHEWSQQEGRARAVLPQTAGCQAAAAASEPDSVYSNASEHFC